MATTIDSNYSYQPNRVTTSTLAASRDPSQLGMEDFLQLMIAQMQNQDMMNPVSDTEFISQMATFSTLEGINTIMQYQLSSYAASYAGKYVTIAQTGATGNLESITGLVEKVVYYDGTPKVSVNGTLYDLHTVMEVSNQPIAVSTADDYVGKYVQLEYPGENGDTVTVSGEITGFLYNGGSPMITVDGVNYSVSLIKKLQDEPFDTEATDPETEETEEIDG